jgi:hypothetical protein
MYSTSEVAKMLGRTRRDISFHCRALGLKKVGNVYMITAKDIKRIKTKLKKEN